MKKLTILMALALIVLLTGCSSDSTAKATEIDTKELLADTKALVVTSEEVYRSGREFTAEEESAVSAYEVNYEDIEETDVKLLVNYALMVVMGAKRLDGVEDTFSKDFDYVNTLIDEMEKGAPLK